MGQYYYAVLLAEAGVKPDGEHIRAWLSAHDYGNGVKLTEHSYVGNKFMSAVEHLLCPDGAFYKSRIVWAGDYADVEPGTDKNLYHLALEQAYKAVAPPDRLMDEYRYIVNHTKKQYVDKDWMKAGMYGLRINPLSLLTAEGNGAGGGDYRGPDEKFVGTWARDVISVEKVVPEGFTEMRYGFMPH